MSADGQFHDDRALEQVRVPPQSIEAEQAVLGGLMVSADSIAMVADLLQPEDFYRRDHQTIYRAICSLHEKGQGYDAVFVGDWFESMGIADQVEGGSYLVDLANSTWTVANIRGYAKIVADKASLRKLIEIGTEIVNNGFQPDGRETSEIIAGAAAKTANLTLRGAHDGGLRMLRAGIPEAYDEIVSRYQGTSDLGLPPPWPNVGHKLPGLEDTDLMVIAARPGMGKTVAGMEWADHAAALGRNVAVFSLEMSRKQLILRMLARRARVDQSLMRMKEALSDEEWARIGKARKELWDLPIAIDDTASLTIDGLKARAARMHAKVPGGLGLIVVDYLQLLEGDGRRDEKRHDEVSKISRGLKYCAKELHCPVIALSQLNRSVETRTDKRPIMSDLRESGAIEQDADVIAFLYRDDYYSKDRCGAPGVAEFIIGKQRQGPLGTAYLRHHLESSYFDDYHGPRPNYTKAKAGSDPEDDGFDYPSSGRDRAAGSA